MVAFVVRICHRRSGGKMDEMDKFTLTLHIIARPTARPVPPTTSAIFVVPIKTLIQW